MDKKSKASFLSLVLKMKDLPSLPASIARVMDVLDDPESSSGDLCRAILLDQSLASKLLGIVNSVHYGFPRKIDNLEHAVTVLGYRSIRQLILVTSLFKEIHQAGRNKASLNRKEFWQHAVGCGVAAKVMAQRLGLADGETFFLAGLLHDIGKVFLDAYLHEEYSEVVQKALKDNLLLAQAENLILGANHTDFGFWLAEKWHLPLNLTHAVMFHHHPEDAPDHFLLTCVVHMADILARALEVGSGGDDLIPAINRQAWAALSLSPGIFEHIVEDFFQELDTVPFFPIFGW